MTDAPKTRIINGSAPADWAIRLLREVSAAAPSRQNEWDEEAKIPWRLVHEIRVALWVMDGVKK
jgi:hypothetical protein